MAKSDTTPATIANDPGAATITMQVIPFGLHVTQVLLNIDGQAHDVLIGPYENEELRQERGMLNCIVGRYTNRLPVGTHHIEKAGEEGVLETISNESPTVSIHGGPVGFDRLVWTQLSPTDSRNFSAREKTAIAELGEGSIAVFSLTSPEGDQGYPGELYTEVLFAALPGPSTKIRPTGEAELGALAIIYRSRLVSPSPVACPINLTQHWGFNLSASLQPQPEVPTVNKHWLRINSSSRLELSPALHPTGDSLQIPKGSAWDFSDGKLIGEDAPDRYNAYYPFPTASDERQPVHVKLQEWEKGDLVSEITSPSPKAEIPVELYSDESGIRAEFQTNQPGVQFYDGYGHRGSGTKKKMHGGSASGSGYKNRPAAYLEFHEPVAAWLHPWASNGDTILTTKEMYNNYVKVIFSYGRRV